MGILGAIMVTRWSLALLRETSRILLDRQAPHELLELVRSTLENDGQTQVTDLHIWSIGSSGYAAAIELLSTEIRDTDYYQVLLKSIDVLSHATIAVHVYVDDTVF
jgi:Co/Zn/Cd efflux system component